jgi:small subunit ribosomal protein S6
LNPTTNVYEALFLLDANRFARERAALPAEVEAIIRKQGGEVLISRLWDDRKLAYPIKGHKRGTYWLIYHRTQASKLAMLNREFDIHEGILRQLTLKIHPHLVDAVLEHAREAAHTTEAAAETEEVPAEAAAV